MIIVIGRGHSGTRAIAHTLLASGVHMGHHLNGAGDLIPAEAMYDAAKIFSRYVTYKGDLLWNFDSAMTIRILPKEYRSALDFYLQDIVNSGYAQKGWKLPETILSLPWIIRRFPDAHYIYWVRDPRDCILGNHMTDNLKDFGIDYTEDEDVRVNRAISWKYQYNLMLATPKPEHYIEIRFEDFVLEQYDTLGRLENFLGIPLATIPVREESIGRWKTPHTMDKIGFLKPYMARFGYKEESDGE